MRIADAWAWLEAHALIGPHPFQSSSANARRITEAGKKALQHGLQRLKAGQRLDVDLHHLLAWTVRRQFLMGEFELAAFAALKEVEVRVRPLGGFSDELVGVGLMAAAFTPRGPGALTDKNAEAGEQEAMMALFRGAIGTFKYPSSHRAVDYDNPVLAAEVVLLADLPMRLLDRIEARMTQEQ
ncbi:TIGR02391 family protein [Arthrobacter pigmenti]